MHFNSKKKSQTNVNANVVNSSFELVLSKLSVFATLTMLI